VSYHRNPSNLGAVPTFNIGIEWAQALGFVLISADDLLAPGALGRAIRVLRDEPDVGLVYGNVLEFADDEEPDLVRDLGPYRLIRSDGWDWVEHRCATVWNVIRSPEAVVRTAVQHQVGPYEVALPHTHDMLNWLRVASVSDVLRIQGPVHAAYRRHPKSLSSRIVGAEAELRQCLATYEMYLATAPLPPERLNRLENVVKRSIADVAIQHASDLVDAGDDPAATATLTSFALEVDPHVTRRTSWWLFSLRRRLGPAATTWFPPFVVDRAKRRFRWSRNTRS
jgi:hypothetical protein